MVLLVSLVDLLNESLGRAGMLECWRAPVVDPSIAFLSAAPTVVMFAFEMDGLLHLLLVECTVVGTPTFGDEVKVVERAIASSLVDSAVATIKRFSLADTLNPDVDNGFALVVVAFWRRISLSLLPPGGATDFWDDSIAVDPRAPTPRATVAAAVR